MTKFQCHYEVLKVTRDAPAEVIRAAYRSLSQKHHPDKNVGNPEAARVMARLNTAYSVLSDAEQRELYDYQILHGHGSHQYGYESANAGDFNGAQGSQAPADQAGTARDSLLNRMRDYVAGRHGRIAAALVGVCAVILAIAGRSTWQDNRSMRTLEQAANYRPGAAATPHASAMAAPGEQGTVELVGKGAASADTSPRSTKDEATVAAPAPKTEPAAAAKASDFERLTAMLKSMGLGLHKLDLPPTAPKAKEAPPKSAEAEKAAPAAKAGAVASAPSAAPAPTQPSRASAVAEAERASAPDVARADAKPQVEASRASVASSASASASASVAARQAPIADMRTCAPPMYPPKAHAASETGTVQVALLVAGDGRVVESKVQKSSGSAELDKAARKAFSQCRFKMPGDDKDAEPVWARLEYVFSLD